jgi:hypothetical protein
MSSVKLNFTLNNMTKNIHPAKNTSQKKTINLLLIGCGPHAKRIYLKALKDLQSKYALNLKLVVELKSKQKSTKTISKYVSIGITR